MFVTFLLVCLCFWKIESATNNNFIMDYYKYRGVANVVGFSCNSDEDNLRFLKECGGQNMNLVLHTLPVNASISKLAYTTNIKLGVFLDISCYEIQDITSVLIDATIYRMFDPLHYWLIVGFDQNDIFPIIKDDAFGISTDFIIAVFKNINYCTLYDTYNTFKDRKTELKIHVIGHWNKENGITIALKQDKFTRRSNLHGINLTASFFKMAFKPDNVPFEIYIQDHPHSIRDGRSKFGFQLLSHLADLYNFTLLTYETVQWKKGDRLGPVARSVAENKADFAGTPINMNALRISVLKFVHQDFLFRTCFIFRNPQPKNIKFHEIFVPLADEVWFMILLLLIITIIVLFLVIRNENFESDFSNFSNSTLMTIGALCLQSTATELSRISTRVAFLFVIIFGLIIYNYYSASVVSARLDEPIFKINDSLSEFAKLNLKMASEWMPYLEFFLKYPDWETKLFYQSYWLQLPETEWYMKPEVGINLVQKGGFAYHAHPDIVYPLIEKSFSRVEICELMEVNLARPSLVAFGVHINSSIVELARVGLCKITETGLRRRQVLRFQHRQPVCRKDILTASSVDIYEFAPYLILLSLGFLSSIVFFILELLTIKYNYIFTSQENIRNIFNNILFEKKNTFATNGHE